MVKNFLLLLFIVIPACEIGVLLLSGNLIGVWPTVGLIILTGVLGTYLAKKQGLETLRRAQTEMQYGRPPGESIIDGVCILVGGVLLLSPGFLTDIAGLLLLIPQTRKLFRGLIKSGLRKWMDRNTFTIIR
ncbi:membrane protein FxsA [Robertmurraya yapensis]|uniref:Membrane protein FxsA n=1 Tax=Bacillus yapensis TaxID=2492960 RepID=A0A3S0JV87_9BACI|nr:FxsA family protein [Bacillus yapensis]RTR29626.1 membrane protein FxsA [Bacillus yapensis]TKS94972.1 membrane protein FxsA [Bacillus yapensis]